jgi:hypothetical protein
VAFTNVLLYDVAVLGSRKKAVEKSGYVDDGVLWTLSTGSGVTRHVVLASAREHDAHRCLLVCELLVFGLASEDRVIGYAKVLVYLLCKICKDTRLPMLVKTKWGTVANEGIAVVFVCNVLPFEGRVGLVNALLEILQHTLKACTVLLFKGR